MPPADPRTTEVVLLIAHGSRNPEAATDHQELCALVAGKSGIEVHPAYLEITEPSIPDAIDSAVVAGATRIRLLPYFLHPGNHVTRDLPQILAAARIRHPHTDMELEPHVGAHSAVVGLVAGIVDGDGTAD